MNANLDVGVPMDATPVSGAQRITSLDTLRGVAVLGILVMNIYAFAMPAAAYSNPLLMGGLERLNLGTWAVTHVLADLKFLSIFSMLFGAGIVLMMARSEGKVQSFTRLFYRRQFWLLLLGVIHAYLLWFGDVLFYYALTGMVVFLFRHKSVRALLILAAGFLTLSIVLLSGGGQALTVMQQEANDAQALLDAGELISEEQQTVLDEWAETRPHISPGPEEITRDVAIHRGSYREILDYRIPEVAQMHLQAFPFFVFWRVAALMFLGMALMKMQVLSGAASKATYRNMMLAGYGLGLPLTVFSAFNGFAHDFDGLYMLRFGMVPNEIGSVLVAIGHIGLVMTLIRSGRLQALLTRFAAVGRMALSNYLLHTLVMTSIFYGYGLNLYTEIPRFGQMGFVLAMIALQLAISPWWLRRYRFGPAEWLWRSLTYWRPQPLRREP